MASGRSSSVVALAATLALILPACASAVGGKTAFSAPTTTAAPNTTSRPPTPAPATTATTTTTTTATTTTAPATTSSTEPVEPSDLGAAIRAPEGEGPFPAVVLVHGGGWVSGDSGLMRDLAVFLTDAGFLTVNATYKLAGESPGYPEAFEDIACAVNLAAHLAESDGTVALIGHSAGAHISAVVSLTGDRYADACPIEGDGIPDKLVGLAGPYDVDRLGLLMLPFFGGGPNLEPDAWEAGNPHNFTDENRGLPALVMYGDRDGIVDESFAINFHNALVEDGHDSHLEVVEGARHADLRQADWVGDLIVVWLER